MPPTRKMDDSNDESGSWTEHRRDVLRRLSEGEHNRSAAWKAIRELEEQMLGIKTTQAMNMFKIAFVASVVSSIVSAGIMVLTLVLKWRSS